MHHSAVRFLLFLGDLLALILALAVSAVVASRISAAMTHYSFSEFFDYGLKLRLYMFALLSVGVLFAFYNRGHYRRRIPWWSQVRYVLAVCAVAFVVDGFFYFAVKLQLSRLWIGFSWAYAALFILMMRQVTRLLADKILRIWRMPTYVVGNGENVVDVLYAIQSDMFTGYDIKAVLTFGQKPEFDKAQFPLVYQKLKVVTGLKECEKRLKRSAFHMIAPEKADDERVMSLIEKLEEKRFPFAFVPPVKGGSFYGVAPQYFFGHDVMLIAPRNRIHSPLGKLTKRSLDVIGSLCGLIALLPVFAALAFTIRRDGGAALFGNKRIGRNGKTFTCWKFRSMAVDAEARLQAILEQDAKAKEVWKTHRKLKEDPRVTSVGKILRKTSMDELPQLWNVLRGDMSLVGPRPILLDETHFFRKDQYDAYCSVRPGVTGLWQVSGRNDTDFMHRVHLDSWYVRNWGLWHDIVILIKTVLIVLLRKGVY